MQTRNDVAAREWPFVVPGDGRESAGDDARRLDADPDALATATPTELRRYEQAVADLESLLKDVRLQRDLQAARTLMLSRQVQETARLIRTSAARAAFKAARDVHERAPGGGPRSARATMVPDSHHGLPAATPTPAAPDTPARPASLPQGHTHPRRPPTTTSTRT
jgi:hypothetical protein